MHCRTLLVLVFSFCSFIVYSQQKGYYRAPCMYGNTVVFTAEGDLWKYDIGTGYTTRLTTHAGMETNPAISPDGSQVVFTGQYEGPTELYIMSINGGVPKRLTYDFDGGKYISEWTKDGKILYRTSSYSTLPSPQLFTLDPVKLTGNRFHSRRLLMAVTTMQGYYILPVFPTKAVKPSGTKAAL